MTQKCVAEWSNRRGEAGNGTCLAHIWGRSMYWSICCKIIWAKRKPMYGNETSAMREAYLVIYCCVERVHAAACICRMKYNNLLKCIRNNIVSVNENKSNCYQTDNNKLPKSAYINLKISQSIMRLEHIEHKCVNYNLSVREKWELWKAWQFLATRKRSMK